MKYNNNNNDNNSHNDNNNSIIIKVLACFNREGVFIGRVGTWAFLNLGQ